jgi:hypothetical protein
MLLIHRFSTRTTSLTISFVLSGLIKGETGSDSESVETLFVGREPDKSKSHAPPSHRVFLKASPLFFRFAFQTILPTQFVRVSVRRDDTIEAVRNRIASNIKHVRGHSKSQAPLSFLEPYFIQSLALPHLPFLQLIFTLSHLALVKESQHVALLVDGVLMCLSCIFIFLQNTDSLRTTSLTILSSCFKGTVAR